MKVRFDKDTAEQLRECSEEMDIPIGEVIRQGIRKVYKELHKEGK